VGAGHVAELVEAGGVVRGPAQVEDHPPGVAEELGDVVGPPACVDLQRAAVEALLADEGEEPVLLPEDSGGIDAVGRREARLAQ